MENLTKDQLLKLAEAYETLITEIVADLIEGADSDKIHYRIYKRVQHLMLEYFGEVM